MREPERPITVSVDGPVIVSGDANRLRQVVDNLLENADVHTPAAGLAIAEAHGGRATVSSRPGEAARFEITLPIGS